MDRLGKYEIRAVLGRGAMGTVYEGWDPVIARRVAIKTVRMPDDADSEEREQLNRFQKEAQAAGRLHHPNIVGVFDYAETGDLAYIVMEFVAGRTLKAMLEGGTPPALAEVGPLMDGLLSGLEYSHAHQVIHRDVKPANVIVTEAGAVKIADFGIARIGSSTMTQAGTIMGTPAYMSPEQFQGEATDCRTDIYSAGVVLFQLLTGRRPFEGGMATIMHAVLTGRAPVPSSLAARVPRAVDEVVARAMARGPADRFPTAGAFNLALQRALRAPGLPGGLGDLAPAGAADEDATVVARAALVRAAVARPAAPAPPQPARASPRRQSGLPLALAGAAGMVLAAGGYWAWQRGTVEAAGPVANEQERAEGQGPAPVGDQASNGTARDGPANATGPQGPVDGPGPRPGSGPGDPRPGALDDGAAGPAKPPGLAGTPKPTVPAAEMDTTVPPGTPALQSTAGNAGAPDPVPPSPLPAAVRNAVAEALRRAPCTAVSGEERPPGTLALRGVAGDATAAAALREALSAAAPGAAVNWGVATASGPYCPVLDLIRPYVGAFGAGGHPVGMALKDNKTDLLKGDLMQPVVTMPDHNVHLQLDYFASDGIVTHLRDARAGQTYPANAVQPMGPPQSPGTPGWVVDEPFGTDLVVAVASTVPLFRAPRPPTEARDAYLRDLRAALDAAGRNHARISATVLMVTAAPGP